MRRKQSPREQWERDVKAQAYRLRLLHGISEKEALAAAKVEIERRRKTLGTRQPTRVALVIDDALISMSDTLNDSI